MLIQLPSQCTIAYADEIIEKCIEACKSRGSLTFSLANTAWIEPFAVTVVAGTIQFCLQKGRRGITYIPPQNEKSEKYLSQIGFNSFFHLRDKKIHKGTSVALTRLESVEPLYIEDLIRLIDFNMRLSGDMKDSLKMSISEILTNVFDHSKSKVGCFICAQYYPNERIIRLCITDFGVGILSNLTGRYAVTTDIDAIKLAVKEGITSRPQSAGFGLSHIRRFLKVNEGTLTIISGKGKVNFYSNKIISYNMSKGFNGTVVNLRINADKESLYLLTSEEDYIFKEK